MTIKLKVWSKILLKEESFHLPSDHLYYALEWYDFVLGTLRSIWANSLVTDILYAFRFLNAIAFSNYISNDLSLPKTKYIRKFITV